jgi:hypothetical protein
MRGEKKNTKTMKKRWARCALPAGFAKLIQVAAQSTKV